MSEDKLVHFDTYLDPYQAEMVRGLLEAQDIPCFLVNSHVSSNMWYLQNALGGTRVMILESDVAQARALLRDAKAHHDIQEKPWIPKTKAGRLQALFFSFLYLCMGILPWDKTSHK